MTIQKTGQTSRFSPGIFLDLRAYVETNDMVIWGILMCINHWSWRFSKGDVPQDAIEFEIGVSENTLRPRLTTMENLGWISVDRTTKPFRIKKTISEMTWDEANTLPKFKAISDRISRNIPQFLRNVAQPNIPQKLRNVAEHSAVSAECQYIRAQDPKVLRPKDTPTPNQVEEITPEEKNLADHYAPKIKPGVPPKTTGENQDQNHDLRRSGFFALWNSLYRRKFAMDYVHLASEDYKAWRLELKAGRPAGQIEKALVAFFDPKSWDMTTRGRNITIAAFFRRASAYIEATPTMTAEDIDIAKSRYYPPFDPRNPYHEKGKPKQDASLQRQWELQMGRPYTPVPEWTPSTQVNQ